jgi:hypothetical protein
MPDKFSIFTIKCLSIACQLLEKTETKYNCQEIKLSTDILRHIDMEHNMEHNILRHRLISEGFMTEQILQF